MDSIDAEDWRIWLKHRNSGFDQRRRLVDSIGACEGKLLGAGGGGGARLS